MTAQYFSELNLNQTNNNFILLDLDGTIVRGRSEKIDPAVIQKIKELAINNEVFLFSNNLDRARSRGFASAASLPYLEISGRKPSRRIAAFIREKTEKPILIIGDKFITDGLQAKILKAKFIKVKRLTGPDDPFIIKISYFLDDLIYKIFK